jgi:glycogen operon protein
VTAIELMPVLEFNENESNRLNPITGKRLKNYWGYDPVAFFAPKLSYSIGGAHGQQTQEFREMVKAFHRAGIEVILDIVLNHTAEGDELGPTISLRGIENSIFYMLRENGRRYYKNFSGVGNTRAGVRQECASLLGHAHACGWFSVRPCFGPGPR